MVRKLSLAVALALGISSSVHALGLGEIQLKSGLNQYLSADIELLSVDVDEVEDIRVSLASAEAFNRAGVDRPFILTKLEFKPVETASGQKIIQLTSDAPIREPFLNFLIEVNWPKGKLVREYTVLLDPPSTLDRRPAPVATPTRDQSTSSATSERMARQKSSTPAAPARTSQTPAPAVSTPSAVAVGDYGPTKRNDTLWGISKKVRHQGASMQQMMMALFEANPEAFIGNNINNLKVGQVLRVPDRDEVLSFSKNEAYNAYAQQVNEWRADRQPVAAAPTAKKTKSDSRDTTPTQSAEAPPPSGDTLKIATARPEGAGEAGSSEGEAPAKALEELRQDLLMAEEARAGALQESGELKSRVSDLESQLQDLQRLLELKNDQLAQMQAAVAGADAAVEEAADAETDPQSAPDQAGDTQTGESPAASEDVETVGEAVADPAADAAAADTEQPAEEPAAEAAMADGEQPTEESAADAAMTSSEPTSEPTVAESQPAPKPVAQPEPPKPTVRSVPTAEERSLFERVTGDTTLLGMIIGGTVAFLALLWVLISRRRSNSVDFQESILVNTIDDDETEQLEPPEPTSQASEETSFLSDFSPSDIDALQNETGEVDPLAEADVYIAYGRYQQAEELVRQAISKDPERFELKQKLAEILFATKDEEGYLALAEEMQAANVDNENPELWGRITSMGSQLLPSAALFSGAAAATSTDGLDSLSEEVDELLSLDGDAGDELNLDDISVEDSDDDLTEQVTEIADEDTGFDLDLNLDSLDAGIQEDTAGLESLADVDGLTENTGVLDIDAGLNLDGESAQLDQDDLETFDTEQNVLLDSDTDLDLDVVVEPEDLSKFDEPTSEVIQLKIDDPLEEAEVADLANEGSLDLGDLDDIDLNLSDLGDPSDDNSLSVDAISEQLENALEEASQSLGDLNLGANDFELPDDGEDIGAEDEINTKIDLARAYIDMGDPEGAKDILAEVLEEGSDEQKGDAQSMLDSLS